MLLNFENVEYKAIINTTADFRNVIEISKRICTTSLSVLNQTDTYYDIKDTEYNYIKLRIENDKIYKMLKYKRDFDKDSNSHIVCLCFKNKLHATNYTRDMISICTVIKHRLFYKYKNTRIHIDIVENLGNFIEFESTNADISELNSVKFMFKNVIGKQIKKSYSQLLIQKNKK